MRYVETAGNTRSTFAIMPPEAVSQDYYITATIYDKLAWDVFSFGKLMEIINVKDLYELQLKCLEINPSSRPVMQEVRTKIQEIIDKIH